MSNEDVMYMQRQNPMQAKKLLQLKKNSVLGSAADTTSFIQLIRKIRFLLA